MNEQVPDTEHKILKRRASTDLEDVADKIEIEVPEKEEISFVLSQSPKTRSRMKIVSASQEDLDALETRCSPAKDYQVRKNKNLPKSVSSSSDFELPDLPQPPTEVLTKKEDVKLDSSSSEDEDLGNEILKGYAKLNNLRK